MHAILGPAPTTSHHHHQWLHLVLATNKLVLVPSAQPCNPAQTTAAIAHLFASTQVHRDRLVYALAGKVFTPQSPRPFGGARSKPGYTAFNGLTPQALLQYIVTETYRVYTQTMAKGLLAFLARSVADVMEMQWAGMKDEIDECLLKGMKRAGHCAWFGAVYIPRRLRHCGAVRVATSSVVQFGVRRGRKMEEFLEERGRRADSRSSSLGGSTAAGSLSGDSCSECGCGKKRKPIAASKTDCHHRDFMNPTVDDVDHDNPDQDFATAVDPGPVEPEEEPQLSAATIRILSQLAIRANQAHY
ncbi:hypothetical protein HDU98_007118 [Podochytrium sp. JEL0797]|nr:hypothetical protein HDU98_007118 [Podochytrium sp. JEL0797]